MWFDIPIPFEKGDIVCDNACIYTRGIPFVLMGTVPWYKKEHPSPRGAYNGDYSDMNAYGYSYDFDRQFFYDDFSADYLNLERSALSKELGKMQREGLIKCRKNHFRLIETGQ